jgi:hypothetical protein
LRGLRPQHRSRSYRYLKKRWQPMRASL